MYTQAVVQFRCEIKSDGTFGKPEIVGRFAAPYKGSQQYKKKATPKAKPKAPRTMTIQQVQTGEL